MKQEMVGQSNQLKGGSHQPHQCSINGMEWVWIDPWSAISNCGSFHCLWAKGRMADATIR